MWTLSNEGVTYKDNTLICINVHMGAVLSPGIEKSENVADISKKYRISDGAETIIVTDYRSTEKSTKNRQNRRYIGEISAKYRFIEKFPDIFLPVHPAHRIQNLTQKSWI